MPRKGIQVQQMLKVPLLTGLTLAYGYLFVLRGQQWGSVSFAEVHRALRAYARLRQVKHPGEFDQTCLLCRAAAFRIADRIALTHRPCGHWCHVGGRSLTQAAAVQLLFP